MPNSSLAALIKRANATTFGLGQDKVVQALEIEWPSGTKQRFTNVPTNQIVTVDEAKGIVR